MSNKFKVGDKVKRVDGGDDRLFGMLMGNEYRITLISSQWLNFEGMSEHALFNANYFELVEEKKQMKREDKINVEMTLQEAAQIYAVIGFTNGSIGFNVWQQIKDILDPNQQAYKHHIQDKFEAIQYINVQKGFEDALFNQKSPAQVELEFLQEKIADLQLQASKLQDVINK